MASAGRAMTVSHMEWCERHGRWEEMGTHHMSAIEKRLSECMGEVQAERAARDTIAEQLQWQTEQHETEMSQTLGELEAEREKREAADAWWRENAGIAWKLYSRARGEREAAGREAALAVAHDAEWAKIAEVERKAREAAERERDDYRQRLEATSNAANEASNRAWAERRRAEALAATLRKVEWLKPSVPHLLDRCPSCENAKPTHSPKCALRRALAGEAEKHCPKHGAYDGDHCTFFETDEANYEAIGICGYGEAQERTDG